MSEHQISDLLTNSLNNIKEMLKVDLIIGDPINLECGLIIPIARVKCGFVSGGMDQKDKSLDSSKPFGGATGGSITLTPIAFISVINQEVKILHLEEDAHILEKTIDSVSELIYSLTNKNNK